MSCMMLKCMIKRITFVINLADLYTGSSFDRLVYIFLFFVSKVVKH